MAVARPYGSRDDVLINNADEANGVLSNMTRTAVTVGGLAYASPEHFFQVRCFVRACSQPAFFHTCTLLQAMKFFGCRYSEVVRQAATPAYARQAASLPGAIQVFIVNHTYSSYYFLITTYSTVGYGDVVP